MTMVASLEPSKFPLLIGDILLSGSETPGQSVHIPSIGDSHEVFPEGSGWVPVSTCQKLAVIGDNLAIGWAGNWLAARTVMKELMDISQAKRFTASSLEQYFNSAGKTVGNTPVGFVGFISDHDGIQQFGYGSGLTQLQTDHFGRVGLLGTGTEHAKQMLSTLPDLSKVTNAGSNALAQAVMAGLVLSGHFHSIDISSRRSLLSYYGGGYELISLVEGKFRKIDDITYLVWTITFRSGRKFAMPHLAVRYAYCDDALIMRTVRFTGFSETGDIIDVKEEAHLVSPVNRDVQHDELDRLKGQPLPTMNAKWLCNYFIAQSDEKLLGVGTHAYYSEGRHHPVHFEEDTRVIRFAYREDWSAHVVAHALNAFDV